MRKHCVILVAFLAAACSSGPDAGSRQGAQRAVPPPLPEVAESTYRFTVGELTFTADGPSGYVTGLWFRGRNLLIGSEVNNVTYGSSFWTSPQTWRWPPAIDDAAYTHRIDAATNRIVFNSAEVTVNDHPLSIEKRFWGDTARGAVVTEVTVTNRGTSVLRFAPWQVTRVAAEGLVFYPRGEGDPAAQGRGAPPAIRTMTVSDGIVWYDFTGNDSQSKSVSDGAEGWLAYVADGVLLLKRFVDIPAGSQAAGEAEVEVYTAPGNRLIELEPQGAAVDLAPGATSAPWRVYWSVHAVPAGIEVSVGSRALVDWVRSLAVSAGG
jgi:hypothetical protein